MLHPNLDPTQLRRQDVTTQDSSTVRGLGRSLRESLKKAVKAPRVAFKEKWALRPVT